jgi:hypothetical protein
MSSWLLDDVAVDEDISTVGDVDDALMEERIVSDDSIRWCLLHYIKLCVI